MKTQTCIVWVIYLLFSGPSYYLSGGLFYLLLEHYDRLRYYIIGKLRAYFRVFGRQIENNVLHCRQYIDNTFCSANMR
jgi:hypothetical protein